MTTVSPGLRSLPETIRQQQSLMEAGRTAGFTPCRVAVAGLPDQVRNLLRDQPDESALLAPFLELPPRFDPSERSRILQEARRAYSDLVAPALKELHEYPRIPLPAGVPGEGRGVGPSGRLGDLRLPRSTHDDDEPHAPGDP